MKDIRGYEGLYAITMSGRIWSHYSKKFLKLRANRYGYIVVNLHKDGDCKTF